MGSSQVSGVVSPADAAGKSFWNDTWSGLPPITRYPGPVYEQHEVLHPFLSKQPAGNAIEIGCVPGNWMIYLNKEYGHNVSGIDYSEHLGYVKANLEYNDIKGCSLYHENFFEFKPPIKYDLVFSTGFAEHFEEYQLVVQKHADLAAENGLVVIIVPNLTHIHRVLSKMFAPDLLAKHRLYLMYEKNLRNALQAAGLEVLFCDYHKTFRPVYNLPWFPDLVSRAIQKGLRTLRLDKFGNAFASPYLISVSRKH